MNNSYSFAQRQCSILSILKNVVIYRVLRIVIGGIFLYASYDKILHPDQFAEIITSYKLVPWLFVNSTAIWLTCLEFILGVLLIFGIWVRASALLLTGLVFLFISGIISAFIREIPLNCGCFSTDSSGSVRTWSSLWQEGILFVGCIYVWFIANIREN